MTGDLVGGDAALDFVNTITGRDESPRDWLDSYARLLQWTALVQLLPDSIVRALAKRARREPAAAVAALTRAKSLREAMFAV
ncbi:MAG: ABATE domain-containing protein, partial [Steroidobacteraceae bacterium]